MLSLFPVVNTAITNQAVPNFLKLPGIGIMLGFILLAFRKGLNYHLISSIIYLVPSDMPLKSIIASIYLEMFYLIYHY